MYETSFFQDFILKILAKELDSRHFYAIWRVVANSLVLFVVSNHSANTIRFDFVISQFWFAYITIFFTTLRWFLIVFYYFNSNNFQIKVAHFWVCDCRNWYFTEFGNYDFNIINVVAGVYVVELIFSLNFDGEVLNHLHCWV